MSAARDERVAAPSICPRGTGTAEHDHGGDWWAAVRGRWTWLLPPLVIAMLMAPMLLTARAYASDWSNNLWLVWQQSLNIRELGHPSYFVQSALGAFYPQFLFYGGTLFSVVGLAASALGEHPLAAYIMSYTLALAAAYGGWLWLCRQAGLAGWRAHVPAVLYLTSSYYVTNIYGRGDFGEVVATSAIPLAVACAVHLTCTRYWRVLPVALFVVAVVFLTGSHPLTLVWGVTVLGVMALALLPGLWPLARRRRRRLLLVGGVAAVGLGVNAWTLLPTIAYHGRVFHGVDTAVQQTWYSTPGVLFGILRDTANPSWITGDVQTQGPVLGTVLALVALMASWRTAHGALRRVALGLGGLLVVLVWLVLSPGVLGSLPSPWDNIQFPFRLVTYVTLTSCGLVAAALLALRRSRSPARRWCEAGLAVAAVVSVGLAAQQVWDTPSFYYKSRNEVFASATKRPPSYYLVYGAPDYADISAPVVTPTLGVLEGGTPPAPRPGIELPSSPFNRTYDYPIVVARPGTVATNVASGPYLVTVKGASPAGRTPTGFMVIRITGSPGEHETLSFATAPSRALRLGLVITLASLAAFLALLACVFVRGRRRRSGPPSRPAPPAPSG